MEVNKGSKDNRKNRKGGSLGGRLRLPQHSSPEGRKPNGVLTEMVAMVGEKMKRT